MPGIYRGGVTAGPGVRPRTATSGREAPVRRTIPETNESKHAVITGRTRRETSDHAASPPLVTRVNEPSSRVKNSDHIPKDTTVRTITWKLYVAACALIAVTYFATETTSLSKLVL